MQNARKTKFIRGLDGLHADDHMILQPWVTEARSILAKSNVLSIYGPRRHGKTALACILRGWWQEALPNIEIEGRHRRLSAIHAIRALEAAESSTLARIVGWLFKDLGIGKQALADQSSMEMSNTVLSGLDDYCHALRAAGENELRCNFDEMDVVLTDPEFRRFFAGFIKGVEARDDVKITVATAYPLAAYYARDDEKPVVPEVRIQKWDRATIGDYVDCINMGESVPEKVIDNAYNYFGGCPFFFSRAFSLPSQRGNLWTDHIDEYLDKISLILLAGAADDERKQSIEILLRLKRDTEISLHTPFERASGLHLLIAGVAAERPDGRFTSAGKGFDLTFDGLSADSLERMIARRAETKKGAATQEIYPLARFLPMQLEPILAARENMAHRPGFAGMNAIPIAYIPR